MQAAKGRDIAISKSGHTIITEGHIMLEECERNGGGEGDISMADVEQGKRRSTVSNAVEKKSVVNAKAESVEITLSDAENNRDAVIDNKDGAEMNEGGEGEVVPNKEASNQKRSETTVERVVQGESRDVDTRGNAATKQEEGEVDVDKKEKEEEDNAKEETKKKSSAPNSGRKRKRDFG